MWLPGEDGGSDGTGHVYAMGFIDDDYRPTPNVQKMGFRFDIEKTGMGNSGKSRLLDSISAYADSSIELWRPRA